MDCHAVKCGDSVMTKYAMNYGIQFIFNKIKKVERNRQVGAKKGPHFLIFDFVCGNIIYTFESVLKF